METLFYHLERRGLDEALPGWSRRRWSAAGVR